VDWLFFAATSALIFARRCTPRLRLIWCLDLSPLIADIHRLYLEMWKSGNPVIWHRTRYRARFEKRGR
jgi:hypothetical protein